MFFSFNTNVIGGFSLCLLPNPKTENNNQLVKTPVIEKQPIKIWVEQHYFS